MKGNFIQIWHFRMFIIDSVISGFRMKFARSRLGGLWGVISPLCQSAVYALVLSSVFSPRTGSDISYAAYLLAGTLGWAFFSDLTLGCLNVFTDNANIIKKVSFPSVTLPVAVVGTSAVNSFLLMVSVAAVFVFTGQPVGANMLWIVVLYLPVMFFGLGLGFLLGILNVFMRDIKHMVQIVMQFWFWLTPIVYIEDIIPAGYRNFLKLNPMYHTVKGFQDVLVFGRTPDFIPLLTVSVLGIALILFSLRLFEKAEGEMADVL